MRIHKPVIVFQPTLFSTPPQQGAPMIGDERVPPFADKFMTKAKKDPLVPIGALATLGFLVSGRSTQL